MSQRRTAVVAGIGPGLGAALCRALVGRGYEVVGLARRAQAGERLVAELAGSGGAMRFLACDVTDGEAVGAAFEAISRDGPAPQVLVYNAGRFLMRPFAETDEADFTREWQANCLGGFLCARAAAPPMIERGSGAMVFTGATASVKAAAHFAAFGSGKFALRGMAQAMARELGPLGVHVAHVLIDGHIYGPRDREDPGVEPHTCLDPAAIADTYLQLIAQPRSAWTFELDLRPHVETF